MSSLARPDCLERIPLCSTRWRAHELDDALFAAAYFLLWQVGRQGARWASRTSRHDAKPDMQTCLAALGALDATALRDYCLATLQRYAFRAQRPEASRALCRWLQGDWPLTLCTDVPSPRQVLQMQSQGTRPVTVIAAYPQLLAPVHDKEDAFHFFVHDLEHAHRFFEDPESHAAQRKLAQALLSALDAGEFASYLGDPVFCAKFEYLMADMNTHVAHALHYLRATLVELHLRWEGKGGRDPLSGGAAQRIAEQVAGLARAVGLPPDLFHSARNPGGAPLPDAAIREA